MAHFRGTLFLFPLLPFLLDAQNLSPQTLLLSKIKERAKENVATLPNFTCLQTIERSRRPAASQRFQLVDTLRLEVAYINRKEVFAWPGSTNFDDRELREFVGGGAIANGSFALHISSIFLSNVPTYTFVGETELKGKTAVRYDYHIPMLHSGYRMRVPPAEGVVGYHGSFFVDAKTLDLMRLEIRINEIPPQLAVLEATEDLDYQILRIGEHDYLLPHKSILKIKDFRSNINRNETTFTRCREFKGDSVVRFDDAPVEQTAAPKPRQRVELPAGLEFEFRLDEDLDARKLAVGDPVHGVVTRDVKKKGILWIPKGALVSGRITLMEPYRSRQGEYWLVGVACRHLEWEDRFADFESSMQPWGMLLQDRQQARSGLAMRIDDISRSHPRIGILFLKGDQGRLPAGTRTAWVIEPSATPEPSTNSPASSNEKTPDKREVKK